jgi:hypothetical protein
MISNYGESDIKYELEDYLIDTLRVSEGQAIPYTSSLCNSYLLLDREEMDYLVSIFEPYRRYIERFFFHTAKLLTFIPDKVWNEAGAYLNDLDSPRIKYKSR